MKAKTALRIFAVGFLLSVLFSSLKVMYLPIPMVVLYLSHMVMIAGGLLLLYKLLQSPHFKGFLDS